MARVLLTTARLNDPTIDLSDENSRWPLGAYQQVLESAQRDRFGKHTVAADPGDAEVILFVEQGCAGAFDELVRYHPYVGKYREKCFVFEQSDFPAPLLPGFYASLRRRHHDPARTRGGFYLRSDRNPYVEFRPLPAQPRYLGSFIGSFCSHRVRESFKNLPPDEFQVEDTSSFALPVMMRQRGDETRDAFWAHFADSMADAAFSLCPRGKGPGSIRLFESMRMGRCPVILSDDWVAPAHVDWASCTITVAEKDVHQLPEILRAHAPRAEELGLRARQEWEKYYAPEACFHWLVEDCLELKRNRRVPETIAARLAWRHILQPEYGMLFLREKKAMIQNGRKFLL